MSQRLWSETTTPHYHGYLTQGSMAPTEYWDGDEFIMHYIGRHGYPRTHVNYNLVATLLQRYPVFPPITLVKLTAWLTLTIQELGLVQQLLQSSWQTGSNLG